MKYLFIFNPAAGGNRKDPDARREAIRTQMDATGLPYEIYVTKAPMDACARIREAAAAEPDLRVVACGGDGTLNECVNGAAGLDNVAVTHFPCGTGNDFIKVCGADQARFFDLQELLHGDIRPIDLMECNHRYSINICSVGVDARIGTDVHKYSRLPLIGGAGGYIVSLIVNLIKGVSRKLDVRVGDMHREDEYALICACNGTHYGGGFHPVPEAEPDDGLLDFLVVDKVSRLQFIRLVGKYAKGRYREIPDVIHHFRDRYMEIRSAKPLVINVDGEALRGTEAYFRIIPGGLRFIFPHGVSCFGGAH